MAFTLFFFKVFKVVLKTLQEIEISHLGVKMTNINVWLPLSFSQMTFEVLPRDALASDVPLSCTVTI